MLPQAIKNHTHSQQMLFRCLRENYHIIQVDEAIGEVQFTQTILHEALESRRGIAQPKRHTLALIKSHTTQSKSSVLFGSVIHRYLPEPRIEIHPSSKPEQQHCTKGCCLVGLLPHPALILNVLLPHPTEEVGSGRNAP